MRLAEDFFTSKTTWVSLATIATTIAGAIQGHIDPLHAALMCLAVLHIPFLRDAWVKSAEDILNTLDSLIVEAAHSSSSSSSIDPAKP